MKIISKYQLRGNYSFDGQEGSQVGEITLCSDGKLVGRVRDSNSPLDTKNPRYGLDKILLGLTFPEESSLGFLKLVPNKSGFAPVIWYATAVNPDSSKSGLFSEYDGLWQWGIMWTPAEKLQLVLNQGVPSIPDLIATNFPHLRDIYFNPENLKFLKESAEGMFQTGKLYFEEIKQ